MAGAGYKLFNTGDVLTAAQVNTYLQEQTVMVFASSTARTTALSGVLAEGMMSYLQDTNAVEVYNGSAWVGVSGAGDVTEVQAGTGISVASGTGPIPVVTNTMATAIDAKGDLVVGTGADTFLRLAVGATNGHVLTVDSSTATGLKYAAAGGGSGLTLIDEIPLSSTSSISANSVFSSTYKNYRIMVAAAATGGTAAEVTLRLRASSSDTSANYATQEIYSSSTSLASRSNVFGTDEWYTGDLGTSTQGGVISFDLTSPNLADRTSFVGNNAYGSPTLKITGGAQTDTTQFDGFTMFFAQSVTGAIFVYGYAKE